MILMILDGHIGLLVLGLSEVGARILRDGSLASSSIVRQIAFSAFGSLCDVTWLWTGLDLAHQLGMSP